MWLVSSSIHLLVLTMENQWLIFSVATDQRLPNSGVIARDCFGTDLFLIWANCTLLSSFLSFQEMMSLRTRVLWIFPTCKFGWCWRAKLKCPSSFLLARKSLSLSSRLDLLGTLLMVQVFDSYLGRAAMKAVCDKVGINPVNARVKSDLGTSHSSSPLPHFSQQGKEVDLDYPMGIYEGDYLQIKSSCSCYWDFILISVKKKGLKFSSGKHKTRAMKWS